LTVSVILDLRVLNNYVLQEKIKFEDWKVTLQLLAKGSFMFKTDLESGYHHIGISQHIKRICGLLGKTVKWFTDSQNCVRIVTSGSMKTDFHNMAYTIFNTCVNYITLDVQWIPREENNQADYISKLVDFDDWGVNTAIFEFIDSMWGPHTIDRFADCYNTKLRRSNSRYWNPGTEAVDGFVYDWSEENNCNEDY